MTELPQQTTEYLIGTAGWSYEDWRGRFYPESTRRDHRPLTYYSRFFRFVEVNTSFYRVVAPEQAEGWCRDVAGRADFRFALKLWQGLTHERPAQLPRAEIETIRDTCRALRDRGRLEALLLQFPWSFHATPQNHSYLVRLLDAFQGLPRVVEIRHADWHRSDFFEMLRQRSVAFCNIDQPQLRDCPPPTSYTTAPFSYLRLHGRNGPNWFRETATGAERYDYYYNPSEVEEMSHLARSLAEQSTKVVVATNNHFQGQAAAGALMLRAALEGRVERIPPPLLRAYPDLEKLPAVHPPAPEDTASQLDMFGA